MLETLRPRHAALTLLFIAATGCNLLGSTDLAGFGAEHLVLELDGHDAATFKLHLYRSDFEGCQKLDETATARAGQTELALEWDGPASPVRGGVECQSAIFSGPSSALRPVAGSKETEIVIEDGSTELRMVLAQAAAPRTIVTEFNPQTAVRPGDSLRFRWQPASDTLDGRFDIICLKGPPLAMSGTQVAGTGLQAVVPQTAAAGSYALQVGGIGKGSVRSCAGVSECTHRVTASLDFSLTIVR